MLIFPYYVLPVGLLLMMLCSTKPLMWHVARAFQSWCPILWATMIGHVWVGRHVQDQLQSFSGIFWDDAKTFLQPKHFFSQREWGYHTERSRAESSDHFLWVPGLGYQDTSHHSPFSPCVFFFLQLFWVVFWSLQLKNESWLIWKLVFGHLLYYYLSLLLFFGPRQPAKPSEKRIPHPWC